MISCRHEKFLVGKINSLRLEGNKGIIYKNIKHTLCENIDSVSIRKKMNLLGISFLLLEKYW